MSKISFTPEQLDSFKQRFSELDIEKEGKLSREIIGQILQCEGEQLEQLMVILLFEKFDQNNDGYIQFEEFLEFCSRMQNIDEETILEEIFKVADADNSGFLDIDEVKRIGNLMGLDITESDAWATISALDQNSDSLIDFNEFLAVIHGLNN